MVGQGRLENPQLFGLARHLQSKSTQEVDFKGRKLSAISILEGAEKSTTSICSPVRNLLAEHQMRHPA